MKLFIVDYCNCLELSHYETFFYKNIYDGNISVYRKSISSYSHFDEIHNWLIEEINRNPFSIDKGLVLFFIPRNLTHPLSYDYIDNVPKMFIRELVSIKLDSRFEYMCVFVDKTSKDVADDRVYGTLKELCKNFVTSRPEYERVYLPEEVNSEENTEQGLYAAVDKVSDPVIKKFYSRVLNNEIEAAVAAGGVQKQIGIAFLQSCSAEIAPIKSFCVSYFGADIKMKTEVLLKLITYVCDFANKVNDSEEEVEADDFTDKKRYDSFDPDYDNLKATILTYQKRLNDWLIDARAVEIPERESDGYPEYEQTTKAASFEHELESVISSDFVEKLLNPSMDELEHFDASERVFSELDQIIAEADKRLKAFCANLVQGVYDFRKDNKIDIPDVENDSNYTEEEKEEICEKYKKTNIFLFNELPGYTAELRLRQELDIINQKIQKIGSLIKAATFKAFLGTLIFAVLSIAVIYFFAQVSVFVKENSWWVFGIYIAVCFVLFIISNRSLKAFYKRKVGKLLDECREKVKEFIENYKKRAEEFENNLNAGMDSSCSQGKAARRAKLREICKNENERFRWHKLKVESILKNLNFFDSFTSGSYPKEEEHIPSLASAEIPYEHDAAHSRFYQMRLYEKTDPKKELV